MAETKARIISKVFTSTGDVKAEYLDNASSASGIVGTKVYATPSLLPTSGLSSGDQAFVTSNQRLYITNGSGWYNVALINATPTFTTGPNATYSLSNDLTPTVITLVAQDSDGQVVTYSATDSGMDGIATLSQDSSVFTITPLTDSAGGNIGSFTITFQATDGIGIVSALSTFTLSFGPTEFKLSRSDPEAYDYFGRTVSMSGDGNYAIVGSPEDDPTASNTGSAYVFQRSGSTWTQVRKLTASDRQADDQFGTSVAVNSDGTYFIVGAKYEDTGGANAGAAYIFNRSGSTWTQQAKIVSNDDQGDDQFGHSVAIDPYGNYVVVGAVFEDGGAGNPRSNAGAAYIFGRTGSTWTQKYKLTASDTAANDRYGDSVSISTSGPGMWIIVGSTYNAHSGLTNPGAAYVYTWNGVGATEQAKLVASDATNTGYDNFGISVSMSTDNTYAVVGAGQIFNGAVTYTGAAYVFTRSGSTWTQQAKLGASDPQSSDWFGKSVSINADGSKIIIGAETEDTGGSQAGAIYVFTRSGSTWTQEYKLQSSEIQHSDYFGSSVSISDDGTYYIVGAQYEDGGSGDPLTNAGAAYIYEAG
jgi:hypothetical protein